jgi:hypothetical protein
MPSAVPQLDFHRLQSDWAAARSPFFLAGLLFSNAPVTLAAMKASIILINRCIITC